MPRRTAHIPAYRLHKTTGQARVIIAGKHFYLGKYGTPASREKYARLLAEHCAGTSPALPPIAQPVISIGELILRYWTQHVVVHYTKDGKPSDRQYHIRLALRALRKLYEESPAHLFGPKKLKAVRDFIINQGVHKRGGLNRKYVNDHVRIIKRLFQWAVSEELLPLEKGTAICQALAQVEDLHKGRDLRVKESRPVKPAPEKDVEQTLACMSPQVRTMCQLLRLTGMRPDEVTIMRPCDVEQHDGIWLYRPRHHKLTHLNSTRVVPLGPAAQTVLTPWLDRSDTAYCFSPREVVSATLQQRSNKRSPAKQQRKPNKQRRPPREHYDDESLCQAVTRACEKAGVPKWTPGQLRHNAATRIKNEFGREAARQQLGHSSSTTTEIYVEEQLRDAISAMKSIG